MYSQEPASFLSLFRRYGRIILSSKTKGRASHISCPEFLLPQTNVSQSTGCQVSGVLRRPAPRRSESFRAKEPESGDSSFAAVGGISKIVKVQTSSSRQTSCS